MLRCFDTILINKYNNYIFYVHNLGGYDGLFILKILRQANIDKEFEFYKLFYLFRDNKLLKLVIKINVSSVRIIEKDAKSLKESNIKITLYDFFKLLNNSLYNLSNSFGVSISKGYFPHGFF